MRKLEAFSRAIHESGVGLALAVTGGGSRSIPALLTVPGASASLLEAVVPYSAPALQTYLGHEPDQACSAPTALQMAAVAYWRALRLAHARDARETDSARRRFAGVACTASLASTRPKRGPHRCHVAVQSRTLTRLVSLQLEKGHRTRAEEEDVVAQLILQQIGEFSGVPFPDDLPLRTSEQPALESQTACEWLVQLCHAEREVLWSMPDGSWQTELAEPPVGLLCGSFNPLHDGHKQLRMVAESILQGPVRYELTVRNADKPALDYVTIGQRRQQFTEHPLLLSSAGTFVLKAQACRNTVFVVGFDTAARILDPRFYEAEGEDVAGVLERIRACGGRFLVAGRADDRGFHTVDELSIPPGFAELFARIPESAFRRDLSSTELRAQQNSVELD